MLDCFFRSNNAEESHHWAQTLKDVLALQKATISSTQGSNTNSNNDASSTTSSSSTTSNGNGNAKDNNTSNDHDNYNDNGAERAKKCGADLTCLRPSNPSDPSSMQPILHGTTSLLPNGLYQSMEDEFRGTKYWDEYDYVVHQKATESTLESMGYSRAIRDKGHTGMTLGDFVATERSQKAQLSHAEVSALRLTTSPWFNEMNKSLRTGEKVEAWSTSISMLLSALLKLSVLSPPKRLYRAMKGELADGAVVGSTHIDAGVLTCSDDPEIAVMYSGNTSIKAVILCVESTFSCRAGCIGDLSQCAEESEWTFPPYTALEILDIEQCGNKTLVRVRPTTSVMRHYTTSLRYPWSSPNDPLTWEEYDLLEKAIKESKSSSMDSSLSRTHIRETKFSSYAQDIVTGVPKIAALGLEAYMKQSMALPKDGVSAIEKEFKKYGTKTDKEWFKYIMYEPASRLENEWGVRDDGRDGVQIEWFHQHENAKIAGLTLAHVLALRLYTCPVFLSLNNPLRNFLRDKDGNIVQPLSMAKMHHFPVTIAFIDDGIRKLRAVEAEKRGKNGGAESDEVILWRGMKNINIPEEFIRFGGVEMAPMSTSLSIKIASHYALKGDANMIFRIVSKNFMDRGANIEFLSCFPKEQEYLFAPLTFLSPSGRSQWVGNLFVIEVTPRL